ncbi:membrane protein [Actinomycetes bacterium]|nr:membrane protein [Actinomycetes bacterium]
MFTHLARTLLGAALTYAGITHLTTNRKEFLAQVPTWVPLDADFVVVASGVVEILLGLSLIILIKHQVKIGWITAAFFVAIFPGNISQYVNGIDAFGLDTDQARLTRLFFQPLLVIWALWCTGAWKSYRNK